MSNLVTVVVFCYDESEIRITEWWPWHPTIKGVKTGYLVAIFDSGCETHSIAMYRIWVDLTVQTKNPPFGGNLKVL